MPIQKFRDLDEMRRALWCEALDEDCIRRIDSLWARSSAMRPRTYPRGVFKFSSLEEAQAAREKVTQENVWHILPRQATEK